DDHQRRRDDRERQAPQGVGHPERVRGGVSHERRQPLMPFLNSVTSAAVTVTTTIDLFGPPGASISALTPRDPAEAIVWLLVFSLPRALAALRPNLRPEAGGVYAPIDPTAAGLYDTDA